PRPPAWGMSMIWAFPVIPARGRPAPRDFPVSMMSGSTPKCSLAKNLTGSFFQKINEVEDLVVWSFFRTSALL
ncbi:MAG: hypothetical protein MIO92_11655, partial [Methanosarcinaceae archaeon]|nr:hypothetical protein [Methanosarcinaceae archaeon]